MANVNLTPDECELQDVFGDIPSLGKFLAKMLDTFMQHEAAAHVGAQPYERSGNREGYRSGTKPRTVKTRVGDLKLDVPQVRGCEPYHPSMLAKWQRSERALLVACSEMYFQGVATRNVKKVLQAMGGLEVSAGQVSRIAHDLEEQLAAFRCRRLDYAPFPYVLVDARYEKARVNGRIVSQAVLITAGINALGQREILDWRLGDSESEATWSEVFRSLKDRGLHGVTLVVSDAHAGIKAAMNRHMQGVAWQRCRVHFKRDLLHATSYKHGKELTDDIRSVLAPEERVECLQRAEEMAAKWEHKSSKVARLLRDDFESCLTVCDLPSAHRRRLNSTNMLERVMKELKKRTRSVGIFPNSNSCDLLIGSRLIEMHEHWQLEPARYLAMEHLEATQAIEQPA